SLLPDGSYTIEAFVTPFGLEDGNGNAVYFSDSSQYGVSTQNGFIVGPLTSHVYPGLRSKTNNYLSGSSLSYCSHEIMFTYGNEGTYAWKLNDFSLYNHSVNTERKVSEGFTFTLTHDLKAASSSAYTVYDNGKESGSHNVSGASFVSKANAQNKTVDLFYGFPVTVYSVRVYDRVLSAEEQRQNHFADLAFYYGLDLSALFDLMGSDYQKALASLSDAFGDVSAEYGTDFAFGYEKAYALYCRIMEEETGTSPDSRTFYEKLYSNVGLAAHFDAMNADTADIAKHTWLSSVNASDVMTLQTFGSVDTFFKNGNGVGYTLSGSQSKSSSVNPQIGFNLPVSLIPEKSYTLEMLVRPVGTTQDGNPSLRSASKSDCQWLVYNAVAIGPLKSLFFTTAASGAENECFSSRWNYMAGENSQTGNCQEYGLLAAFGKGNAHNGYLAANANLSLTADVINYSVTYTVNEGADKTVSGASYTFRSDANVTGTKTITAANYVPNSAVTSQNYFRLFYGLPATLYSVRLYDRPLSESERLQNHFADLISYFHMGSIEENWNNLTEAERKEIYEKCEKITVNDSAKDVNSVLFSYFYTSGLYVTDGLTALFSALAGQDENIHVKTGVWKSSVGNATATLFGNGWSYNGKTQGLGYYRHFDGFTDYAYVSLPVSLISGSAFTVEVFADVTGIREDNGGRYGGDEYLNRSFDGAYVIGNLKAN
ncbi:MAG: hypothetical protein MJ078_04575, partial [Clostridia bacterium]|nr:hypothetical protein [Clostridia bacterium]